MDQFGVKKAALKAMARTPVIPAIAAEEKPSVASAAKRYWLGAALHGLEGEEFSAFGVGKEEGGVQLSEVPAGSGAAKYGLKGNDLVQGINGRRVSNTDQLFSALATAGSAPLKLRIVRNQQARELVLDSSPFVLTESAAEFGFKNLYPSMASSVVVTANQKTDNDAVAVLTDGKLAKTYGPVFGNGIRNGAYKIDLGTTKSVKAVSSWAFNQNGNRGRQIATLYGSNSATDPGWNTSDAARFTPITTLDTVSAPSSDFSAASIRARDGDSLGSYRWIVWQVEPVTPLGENTSYQEFSVESGSN